MRASVMRVTATRHSELKAVPQTIHGDPSRTANSATPHQNSCSPARGAGGAGAWGRGGWKARAAMGTHRRRARGRTKVVGPAAVAPDALVQQQHGGQAGLEPPLVVPHERAQRVVRRRSNGQACGTLYLIKPHAAVKQQPHACCVPTPRTPGSTHCAARCGAALPVTAMTVARVSRPDQGARLVYTAQTCGSAVQRVC